MDTVSARALARVHSLPHTPALSLSLSHSGELHASPSLLSFSKPMRAHHHSSHRSSSLTPSLHYPLNHPLVSQPDRCKMRTHFAFLPTSLELPCHGHLHGYLAVSSGREICKPMDTNIAFTRAYSKVLISAVNVKCTNYE
jgi:hypothetical protein